MVEKENISVLKKEQSKQISKDAVIQLAKLLISNGKLVNSETQDIEQNVKFATESREWLHKQKIDDILEYVDLVGKYWSENFQQKIGANSNHVKNFLSKDFLGKKLDIALHGNRYSLDEFVDLDDPSLLFHAQPRGISCHWIAGNVDILGIFSVIQALVTKNISIIKTPANYELLVEMLMSLEKINTESISGKEILKCFEVMYVEKSDIKNQEILSNSANIRIAWGGHDAVESILSLPKNVFTEDIIYGPKYSYAIIDEESIKRDKKIISQKIALDVSTFDQYACSSPHTVFVKTKDKELISEFSRSLAQAMEDVERIMLPKAKETEEKSKEIISTRSEYEIKGKVISSKNLNWTVIVSEDEGFAEPTFSRVIHVRPFTENNMVLKDNRKIQSIGISVDNNERFELIDKITFLGGDRCPSLGKMSFFDSPWDGMFGMDRMVRWITTYK